MILAKRIHLFPSRTQQLSSLAPMILGGKLPGKVGRCQFSNEDPFWVFFVIKYCFVYCHRCDIIVNDVLKKEGQK